VSSTADLGRPAAAGAYLAALASVVIRAVCMRGHISNGTIKMSLVALAGIVLLLLLEEVDEGAADLFDRPVPHLAYGSTRSEELGRRRPHEP